MANPYYVPPAPAITKIEPVTFFGKPGAHISGTEDLSSLPSGSWIAITVFDMSRDSAALNRTPIEVNSDGTWSTTGACESGDRIFAQATVISGENGGGTAYSPIYTVP